VLYLPPALVQPGPQSGPFLADFDQALAWLKSSYAWGERVNWILLQQFYRPKMAGAKDTRAFQRLMEQLLDEFADAHTHLGSNFADSWRLPPGDLATEWQGQDAVIFAVKPGSRAERAGLRAGMKVLGIQGEALAEAVASRKPWFLGEVRDSDRHWSLNARLAGRHGEAMALRVQEGSQTREIQIPAGPDPSVPVPETRLLRGHIGYIAFPDFGSPEQVRRMDDALQRFPQARGWILDVRFNSGGDTDVMKPILGRFLSRKVDFAFMRRCEVKGLGAPWKESVSPRGRVFQGPLAVLVAPWTESVSESLAMAVQGTRRGQAFGTRTAGLDAAVRSIQLHHSKLRVQASVEPVYDLAMNPRSAFRPGGMVDLASATGPDPILDAALEWVASAMNQAQLQENGLRTETH
jgi:carboxyl-terminal processing protease